MKNMKLALIGYGKMGKAVEEEAVLRNHTISLVINDAGEWADKFHLLKTCDAAIEFTMPGVAVSNIFKCFDAGVPVVCGTTGWHDALEEVKSRCTQQNGTLFYASNFSPGVNMFFEINRRLAQLMNKLPEYEVKIEEIHHVQKLDAPSGTAITLANDIIGNIDRKSGWTNHPASNPAELEIASVREGQVTGVHTVTWDSAIDTIAIHHEAKNRKGFAIGAVLAAEFIAGKHGIYNMKDLLGL